MKKHRFLIIALALSILFHILIFIFAPELKSEINSNDYLKKITKISIFRDENKSAPENRNVEIPKSRNIEKKRAPNRNIDKTTSAESRNNVIAESRDNDTKNTAPNEKNSGAENRDDVTTERRDDEKGGAENRNNVITGSRDNDTGNTAPRDDSSSAPKTAGELAVIPKALNPKTPDYPESLEEEGIEGSVTLELLISKEGKVLKAKVIKSDHELFSESALKAVKKYKFSPGKLADGSSADSLIEFVVKFEISL